MALEGGELVCLLPQGTIPRGAKFYDPVLKGRTGAARLAAMTGAPVIPFGLWGTEEVWPRSEPVPRMFNLTDPPTRAGAGGPTGRAQAAARPPPTPGGSWTAITDCLPPEAREHREPTARGDPARHPGAADRAGVPQGGPGFDLARDLRVT